MKINNSLTISEAIKLVNEGDGRKIIWLGEEPNKKVAEAISLEDKFITKIKPEEIIYYDEDKIKKLSKDSIMLGYTNSTPKFISSYFKNKYNIDMPYIDHHMDLNSDESKVLNKGLNKKAAKNPS